MCADVLALLALCAVVGVIHVTPVGSQCTTKHCYDDDDDSRVLAAISGLQDAVERQGLDYQDSLQQLQRAMEEQENRSRRVYEESLQKLQHSMEEQDQQLTKLNDLLKRQMPPKDCFDIQRHGHNVSDVYEVYLDQARKFVKVYCDLESDNGGWLVFQRRQDGSVDFYRNWAEYKAGFGNLTGEFWLGNDLLHDLTSQRRYTLRIDLEDFMNASRFAIYQNFAVSSESDNFRVSFGAYSGTAGDSFTREVDRAFSTRDRDNDAHSGSCAQICKGAWWYKKCNLANLNGHYLRGSHASYDDGVEWHSWHGYHYSLKRVTMKVRP